MEWTKFVPRESEQGTRTRHHDFPYMARRRVKDVDTIITDNSLPALPERSGNTVYCNSTSTSNTLLCTQDNVSRRHAPPDTSETRQTIIGSGAGKRRNKRAGDSGGVGSKGHASKLQCNAEESSI